MKRRKWIYLVVILGIIVLGGQQVWQIVKQPHELTTTQVLAKFSWQVKAGHESLGIATFTANTMAVTSLQQDSKVHYSVNDDVMTIKSGDLQGRYTMKMAATDYKLIPKKDSQQQKTLRLVRND
ncbi:hypothetical protein [Lactiplantibacillus daowaiensis]|uniref:Extracellular protein, membrane-anchored n=1 Tax=Lactiplantibacillus daowaiensis TaxID=2559918 RepID=A0ABW1S354_9LACO